MPIPIESAPEKRVYPHVSHWWHVEHLDRESSKSFEAANELRIPVGRTVTVRRVGEEGVVAQQRVPGGVASRGARALAAYGCGSCHVIPGVTAATGRVGPPLTHFADRTFVAGTLRNEPMGLIAWIQYPQRVSPGTAMPDLAVTDADARDMAAYLYTLVSGRLGPPHLFRARSIPGH